MKKIISLLLVVTLTAASTLGCSSKSTDETSTKALTSEKTKEDNKENSKENTKKDKDSKDNIENSQFITVDKKLGTVTVKLSKGFVDMMEAFGAEDPMESENTEEDADIKKNDDGSMSITMSKKKYNEVLKDLKSGVDEAFTELKEDEEIWSGLIDINTKNNYDVIEFIFDGNYPNEERGLLEGMSLLTSYMVVGVYKMFSGNDDYNVEYRFIDSNTGDVFDTIKYPEALKSEQQ